SRHDWKPPRHGALACCSSQHVFPGAAQPHRTVDDAGHAVSLGEVPPRFLCFRIEVFREQAEARSAAQHVLEQLPRLIGAPDRRKGVDVPERADVESVLGLAEIVGGTVAEHVLAAPQVLLNSRSEEHTSELQSRENLVCRLLLEKKKK